MKRVVSIAVLALAITTHARAETPIESGVVMRALQDELARTPQMQLNGLKKPYYAALEVSDQKYVNVTASLGKIVDDRLASRRALGSRIRVGDYANDSGNFVSDSPWEDVRASSRETSLDDRYDVVRHDAWLSLDASYKGALDAFSKKSAILDGQGTVPDRVDDFSHETATVLVDAQAPKSLDHERMIRLARALSAVGTELPGLQGGSASVSSTSTRRYFVSSEGARIVQPSFGGTIQTVFRAQADDGMPLSTYRSVSSCSLDNLPSDESLLAAAREAATELDEIRRAPVIEDYSGPILFEGVAAAQLLYEILGSSLSGTPAATASEQSFRANRESALAGLVGQRVMPVGFDLEDDPTIDHLGALPLAGCYKVDDEGVPAQKVKLVENGIFKSFLMSRTPRKGFLHSNGHGRESYDGIRAAIGNLALVASKGVAAKDLRARLIAEAKAQNKPYALIVERLAGSGVHDVDASRAEMYSLRRYEQGTKVLVVWRLGLDGKATRVRGGNLGAVAVRSFKDILAAGTSAGVVGYSGQYGHSITSPALLFKDLEVKKPRDASKRPPVLPRPE